MLLFMLLFKIFPYLQLFNFQLTGQPSEMYFKLLSVILEHDSKLREANFEQ